MIAFILVLEQANSSTVEECGLVLAWGWVLSAVMAKGQEGTFWGDVKMFSIVTLLVVMHITNLIKLSNFILNMGVFYCL